MCVECFLLCWWHVCSTKCFKRFLLLSPAIVVVIGFCLKENLLTIMCQTFEAINIFFILSRLLFFFPLWLKKICQFISFLGFYSLIEIHTHTHTYNIQRQTHRQTNYKRNEQKLLKISQCIA